MIAGTVSAKPASPSAERDRIQLSPVLSAEDFPQRTLRPNRQLGNFVEIAKQLSFQTAAGEESRAHRTHRVVPTEEAAQAYKEYLGKIEAERQKIMSEFEQLRQFLDEQERLLLAQLEELDKEIVKIQDENVTKLSEKISRLGDLISEIEEKCQQPTSEFLQRCEKVKFEKPMAVPQDVSEKVGVSSQRNVCLQEALNKFR
ncbi:unnamed protein product, partial [Caretta caretta]